MLPTGFCPSKKENNFGDSRGRNKGKTLKNTDFTYSDEQSRKCREIFITKIIFFVIVFEIPHHIGGICYTINLLKLIFFYSKLSSDKFE